MTTDIIKEWQDISNLVEDRTQAMLKPDGKFIYQIDVNTGKPIKGEYNLLRHFGTIWYLGQSKNSARKAYSRKGLKWADDKYLKRGPKITGAAYIYKDSIKTGGIALSILAKVATGHMDYLQELSDFLLSMQKENGDFIHKLNDDFTDSGFVSEYYTGEILFALATLEKIMPNKKRMKAIMKCIDYLFSISYGVKEQSHWMLYAMLASYKINHNPLYVAHASAMVGDIVRRPEVYLKRGANPLACRIEGMMAHAAIIKEESPAGQSYMTRFSFIEEKISLMLKHYKNGYFHKDGVSQIDTQQHCGTALRNYLSMNKVVENV